MEVLLIHPPAAKAAEPPLGVAVLLAHLRAQGIAADAIDANLEAYRYLLDPARLTAAAGPSPGTALRRAIRHVPAAFALLRSARAERSFARYATAVNHLNRALGVWRGAAGRERLTLGDYVHGGCSEFSPTDLERMARGELTTVFQDYFLERLLPEIRAQQPGIVALSVNYRHQVLPAFALAGLLRRHLPEVRVVGGGGMFSSWRTLLRDQGGRFSSFSRIVVGPGEAALAGLARHQAGNDYLLEDASALAFAPDYSFAPLGDYLSPRPTLQVSASRGCYWHRCLFCPEATTPTHPYVGTSPGRFPDLLIGLSRRFGVRHFHLTDNAVPIAVLRALAQRSADLEHLAWHGFVRFESALSDPGLVAGLAGAGCRMLQLGLESGSQPVLDRLHKGTDLAVVSAVLHQLQRAGILSYVYIMLGSPGETEADAEQTLRFVEEHAGAISFLNIAIMNLPRESVLPTVPNGAGSQASAPLDEEGCLGLYRSFVPSAGWGRTQARRFLQHRLLGSAAIREIVNRTPPQFTSNHAWYFPPVDHRGPAVVKCGSGPAKRTR